jgi:hypothetical protein
MTKSKKPVGWVADNVFKVRWDAKREQYVALSDTGDVLGVDRSAKTAIRSAVREAYQSSKSGRRVLVRVEQSDGLWRTEYVAEPCAEP